MPPPEPLPFDELYDPTTLRRLGVDPEEFGGLAELGLDHEFEVIDFGELPGAIAGSAPEDGAGTGGATQPVPRRVGRPLSSMMLAAAMSGLGEVFEPERRKAAQVEFDPGHDHFSGQPVEFVFVPGSPKLSRIILRPWLRAS